ncbi:hypothetical protein AB0J28_09415 [Streptosporangium canum]|uniref:hypothetical protein n=1 Tax=Streptosporangium canum TaxID=324952 RepID=UPI00343228B9
MPEIPAEAVQAIEEAVLDRYGHAFLEIARFGAEVAAPFIAEQARREVAAHAREIAADSDWGHVNLRAFRSRHRRLVTGDSAVAVLLAFADEIEEPAREAFPKGDDQ